MYPDLATLRELLREVAHAELLPRFAHCRRSIKPDGSIVTEADVVVQGRIAEELKELTPEFELIGEEMTANVRQEITAHATEGLWYLDPLDGTRNFATGVPIFAISLALVRAGLPVLGMVYDPVREECFYAVAGEGVWLNGVRLAQRPAGPPLQRGIAVVDFKRLSTTLRHRLVDVPPYGSQRNFGSVALEWCWLAAGRYHVYLHGCQKPWDYAAGALILKEAGGLAVTLEGREIFEAEMAPHSVVAALDPDLFAEWTDWLGIMRDVS